MIALLIVFLIFFTLLSGFFSGAETALFSLSSMQVRAYRVDPSSTKQLIARLLGRPRELLVTILMLNVLVNLLVQNFASSLFGDFANWGLKVGVPLGLTLIFGEIVPKTAALSYNKAIAPKVAPTIGFFHRVLGPLRRLITTVTTLISKVMFFFLHKEREISEEEVEHALDTSTERGVLSKEEAELIRGYLDFQEISVKEVMRPREEMFIYDCKQSLEELKLLFAKKRCSRVPVCEGGVENIIGVMEAQDFFLFGDRPVKDVLRKPYFVPETMPAKLLLKHLGERNVELAVVVDEYGQLAGLVTREDLVEVVVGEIADLREGPKRYTKASEDVIIASGKMELTEFNDLFDVELESEESLVTIGGWLTEKLGDLPKSGDKFQTEKFLFHVLAAEPNRVRRIYIRRLRQ